MKRKISLFLSFILIYSLNNSFSNNIALAADCPDDATNTNGKSCNLNGKKPSHNKKKGKNSESQFNKWADDIFDKPVELVTPPFNYNNNYGGAETFSQDFKDVFTKSDKNKKNFSGKGKILLDLSREDSGNKIFEPFDIDEEYYEKRELTAKEEKKRQNKCVSREIKKMNEELGSQNIGDRGLEGHKLGLYINTIIKCM